MDNNESVRAGPEEKNRAITVHYSNQRSNAKNCLYPYSGTSGDPEELKELFRHDHTFIDFKDNYRCIDNFMQATVAAFDNDDDHSDDPMDRVDISDIPKLFPGVSCVVSTSQHHLKQKGNKGPRPRYHVAFWINAIQTPAEYTAFLTKVQRLFPFFDKKALDAARFYFGNPDTEVYSFPGYRTLDEFIAELEENKAMVDVALGELLIDFTCVSTDGDGYPTMAAHPGGAPANFLAALTKYGMKTALLGKVGDDAFGKMLVGTLEKAGIETGGIIAGPDFFTTLAFVTLDETGNREFSFARKPGTDT